MLFKSIRDTLESLLICWLDSTELLLL